MILNKDEQIANMGGANLISAAIVTAIVKLMQFCYDVGMSLGGLIKSNHSKSCN